MSIPAYKPSSPEFLRGGRIRKTSKGPISFAPFLAGASVLALGALLATTSPAEAGTCQDTGEVRECSGEASPTDKPVVQSVGANESATFTDAPGFGLSVSGNASNVGNRGFYLRTNMSSTFLTIDLDGDISAEENAFDIGHGSRTDDVMITTDGTITSSNEKGIFVDTAQEATGDVIITANGDISAGGQAVHVQQDGAGAVNVTTGNVSAGVGTGAIQIDQNGAGAVNVTANGVIGAMNVTAAIHVETVTATTGDVEVELNGNVGDIGPNGAGIIVNNLGSGAVAVRANANVETRASGIYVVQGGTNSVTVTSTGDTLDVEGRGISVITAAETMGDVLIQSSSNITTTSGGRAEGILVNQRGAGAVAITTDGTVNSGGEAGIRVRTADGVTTGDVGITVNDDVTGGIGIDVDNQGSGNVTIYVNAEVAARDNGTAIDLNGRGTQTIVLGTGASIAGVIDVDGIEDGAGTVNIEARGNIDDFNFGNVGGKVGNFTISEGAVVGVTGAQSWNGAVTLSGRLVITGNHPIRETGSTFSVASIEGGGVIDIDVDFSGGDASLGEPRISAQSATGSTTVNVRARGGFPAIPETDEDEAITIGNFIQITDNGAAPDTFVAGRALGGGFNFELTHDNAGNGPSIWTLVATGISVEGALYETLPAALTQLARLESYRQRLQGRQHGGSGGAWAKVSNTSGEFEPTATSLATHEIENAVVEFGIDVPFRISSSGSPDNFTVGASVGFGDATTDVTIENGTGEIATSTVKGAISANWEYGSAYVDGQLQYATFGNEFKSDANLVDKNATAYSAGLEVGYDMNIAGVRVIPAAQLAWTSVDVGTFTDSAGTQVVLDDGVVLTGRAGIGAEYGWDGVLFGLAPFADILLRGRADVLMPLDGKVGTKISGTEMTSEREDPVFDFGIGATYAWGDAYAFSADVSARQGGEVEGYAGSVGFEYKF
ncbi:MAG: autotransporter outer membrane beta-barrel domain-containing protein [Hyphomicrobiales bacterium]|nr:autotransporter outer membrane beta-barrel domain-containing protein [Hyphomicrobiales bacterium]